MSDMGEKVLSVEETIKLVNRKGLFLRYMIKRVLPRGFWANSDDFDDLLHEAIPLALEVRLECLRDGNDRFWGTFVNRYYCFLGGVQFPGSSWDINIDELDFLESPHSKLMKFVEDEIFMEKVCQNVERILSAKEILFFRLFIGFTDHGALHEKEVAQVMGVSRDYAHVMLSRIHSKIMTAEKFHLENEVIFVSKRIIRNFEKEMVKAKKERIRERRQMNKRPSVNALNNKKPFPTSMIAHF